ncbi:MAG: hypothetical protein JW798_16310 [Prolixibacteraceae bacterium]|nr:hypothetical protein [Prolixibacteraceae bacterium]
MKKITALFLFIAIGISVSAQNENEFQPTGKVFINVFSNFNASFSDGVNESAFALDRVYFGYQYNLSENFSGKLNFDIGNPGVGKLEMVAYIKNAYITYAKNRFSVNFGMISTTQFKVQEKFWGYRYIMKSYQDEYKLGSSADLGISASYDFTDWLSADVILVNGEGYKNVQADNDYRAGFGLSLAPVKGLTLRGYFDALTSENMQTSVASFVGYKFSKGSIGIEYNMQNNTGKESGRELSGISSYATLSLIKNMKFYARYDMIASNVIDGASWNLSKDGSLIMAGFEYQPVKGVKFAPNYRLWDPADGAKAPIHYFFMSCELKF